MYNNHRNELHLMAHDEYTRDLWVAGLETLIDRYTRQTLRHLIREEK